MRSRSFIAVALAVVLLFAGAGAVLAYDSSQSKTIADGIKVGGIDIGGMSAAKARARLRAAYGQRLARPVVVHYRGERFVLRPKVVHARVDFDQGVQDALERSRSGSLFTRVYRGLTGGSIHATFDPEVLFSRAAVGRFSAKISHRLNRPARDASVSWSGASIGAVSSETGVSVDRAALGGRIEAVLSGSAANHRIAVPITRTEPKVTTAQLASRYPTAITVDRGSFRLRLWKNLRLVKTYEIAVGMAGLETPAGLYHIQDKEVNPSWHVPNSAWAGSLAGQTIPPGPADPIKARWMGIFNGAGIHGTEELGSLGSAASHGCIRMAIPDVIQLYDQTPIGTPVFIE
jgi:lipoprotein-anchoring transpeptidase ErfK/SrfK